jgi:hypothetical protein
MSLQRFNGTGSSALSKKAKERHSNVMRNHEVASHFSRKSIYEGGGGMDEDEEAHETFEIEEKMLAGIMAMEAVDPVPTKAIDII